MSHKKPLTYYVKRNDGELISRRDLQYDLLHHIFSNRQLAFTDPNPALRGESTGSKVTFRDLYVNTLISSPRASKVLRERMFDTPDFATDFAKLALLANVGRINTTMACEYLMHTGPNHKPLIYSRESLSRDENGNPDLPSHRFPPEDEREPPGRSSYQEHPQVLSS
jgi:hypothetical protein